jgi:hypothetical protein
MAVEFFFSPSFFRSDRLVLLDELFHLYRLHPVVYITIYNFVTVNTRVDITCGIRAATNALGEKTGKPRPVNNMGLLTLQRNYETTSTTAGTW